MDHLTFLADEHVDRAYVRALLSNGYDVHAVGIDYTSGIADETHLSTCVEEDRIIISNDRDFVRLGQIHEHAGIIMYTNHNLPVGAFVRAIRRIDRHLITDELANQILWLEEWQ
ncbi:DUF5615 family PIN-like protein [Halocatena marina]|uniref:DUF5615 family PIN-like protein n=1 Tax=Halocatena marina TaxID=2934937 RepID=UPI00200D4C4F|nr:DUF5615 family PIN-like protein [Halocatena marina]